MNDLDVIDRQNTKAIDEHISKLEAAAALQSKEPAHPGADPTHHALVVLCFSGLNFITAKPAATHAEAEILRDAWVHETPGNSARLRRLNDTGIPE